jgi:hypothetical protein
MSAKLDEEELAKVILRRLHTSSRPYVLRLSWCRDLSDARSVLHGASCFAVDVDGCLFGVTAAHVLRQYMQDAQDGTTHLLLDDAQIDPSIIGLGDGIDIATFRLSRDLLDRTGKKPILCKGSEWPPAPPERGKGVVLTGYPKDKQLVVSSRELVAEQVSNCLVVHDIYDNNMTLRVRPRNLRSLDGEPLPPLSMDVGGYSGAPVLTVSSEPGPLFRLGGVLYEGRVLQDDTGEFLDFKVEPISRLRRDGHLNYGVR